MKLEMIKMNKRKNQTDIRSALEQGNRYYADICDKRILTETADKGQRPIAIVV